MSNVSFDEPDFELKRPAASAPKTSLFNRIVIGLGLAHDERSAQRVLLIAAVFIAVIAIAVYFIWGT